jgi:hypothetical protein
VRSLIVVAAVASFAAVEPSAAASGPVTCNATPVSPPPATPYFEYSPRRFELWAGVGELGDWLLAGTMSPALTLGAEFVLPLDLAQRSRLGLKVDAVIGHWAGNDGSLFGLEGSLAYRYSVGMDDFFDWYLLGRPVDVLFALGNSQAAYRPGLGAGLRVVRAVELEGTLDAVVGLGRSGAGGDRAGPGLTLSLAVDTCLAGSFCSRPAPPKPVQRDLTCNLYEHAESLCTGTPDRHALCDAVATAMDASRPLTDDGAREGDPIDAFLAAVEAPLPEPLKTAIHRLRQDHDALLQTLSRSQDAERRAAQGGGWLVDHCSYEPTANELRDAFGCDPDGAPTRCAPPSQCR